MLLDPPMLLERVSDRCSAVLEIRASWAHESVEKWMAPKACVQLEWEDWFFLVVFLFFFSSSQLHTFPIREVFGRAGVCGPLHLFQWERVWLPLGVPAWKAAMSVYTET